MNNVLTVGVSAPSELTVRAEGDLLLLDGDGVTFVEHAAKASDTLAEERCFNGALEGGGRHCRGSAASVVEGVREVLRRLFGLRGHPTRRPT